MKKIVLLAVIYLLIPSVGFCISDDALLIWKSEMGTTGSSDPLGGWICTGSGKTASDVTIGESGISLRSIFPKGSPAYVPVDFENYGIVYVSNSSTDEEGRVEEWLISPEIDLSGAPDNMVIAFDVFSYGNSNSPLFGVYASSSGSDKPEDFTTKIYAGKTENGTAYPAYKRFYLPVSNISNDKVRIGFVNMSNNAMLLGFKNVELCQYQLDVTNNLSSYYQESQDLTVSLDVNMRTPVPCYGFTAVLKTSEGEEQEFVTTKPVGSAYTRVAVTFPEPIHLENGDEFDYTVSITPNYEGAATADFEYRLVCNDGYESVCVLEELTGTWCQWCPRGAVALNYFTDKYKDRFIGIAVHNNDPMALTQYITPLMKQSGLGTFPNGWFNREIAEDPWNPEVVEQLLSRRSGYSVAVKEVAYEESKGLMTVKYAPKVAFDSKSQDITAVVVVTEDSVTGNSNRWNQMNAYSGYTKGQIVDQYGEELWPYFKTFCESGSPVPHADMVYDHVSVGIWNSYLGAGPGAILPKEWKANTEQEFAISFELPRRTSDSDIEGVKDWKNTHVIVMLLDNGSGKVLTAAKMGADDYTTFSSLNEVTCESDVNVTGIGQSIVVETSGPAQVDVFGIDGFKLSSGTVQSGRTLIDAGNRRGPVIVRVVNGNNTYVKKIMF